jgi:hypothetical protein
MVLHKNVVDTLIYTATCILLEYTTHSRRSEHCCKFGLVTKSLQTKFGLSDAQVKDAQPIFRVRL